MSKMSSHARETMIIYLRGRVDSLQLRINELEYQVHYYKALLESIPQQQLSYTSITELASSEQSNQKGCSEIATALEADAEFAPEASIDEVIANLTPILNDAASPITAAIDAVDDPDAAETSITEAEQKAPQEGDIYKVLQKLQCGKKPPKASLTPKNAPLLAAELPTMVSRTKRGGVKFYHAGYGYTISRSKPGGVQQWRCDNRRCDETISPATILTIVLPGLPRHVVNLSRAKYVCTRAVER